VTVGDVPVAILAGGLATRLGATVATLPKALVPVAGRPFIDHQLALLRDAGVRRVVLCVQHMAAAIEAHLGDGSAHGLSVAYARDGERLLGTGGALRRARPLLGDACFVLYGDSYLEVPLAPILAALEQSRAWGVMTVLRNDGRWDKSNALVEDGRLVRYDKHSPSPGMAHIDYGLALLRREAVDRIPAETSYDLSDLYRDLVHEERMIGFEVTRRFYEIGSPEGLAETRALLEARR
jgi:N-acetyl-alpha-D-muramate 1-phosphate uridylyltransferase